MDQLTSDGVMVFQGKWQNIDQNGTHLVEESKYEKNVLIIWRKRPRLFRYQYLIRNDLVYK